MIEISKAEEMVLLAIWRLGDEAYGVSVRRQIRKDTGKDYTYGTLYGLLRQMDHKGCIRKLKGDPLPKKERPEQNVFQAHTFGDPGAERRHRPSQTHVERYQRNFR